MLLFLGCIRPGFGAVQHLHSPRTHFSPVRDRAVTGWTVRNQGTKDQPPLLEMFAYMNPQAGWKTKITSSKNWDGSSQRGWGRSGQACLTRAKWAPLPRESEHKRGLPHSTPSCCPLSPGLRSCAWALLPFSPVSPIPFGVNHHRHDPQGHGGWSCFFPGFPWPGPPGALCQAVPGKLFTLQARLSKPESTGQPGGAIPGSGPELPCSCSGSPGGCAPPHSPPPAPRSPDPRTLHPGSSRSAPRIPDPLHPGLPCTPRPLHTGQPCTLLDPRRSGSLALRIPSTPGPLAPRNPGIPDPRNPGLPWHP